MSRRIIDTTRQYDPQDPCPTCNEPMDGIGWECHCGAGLRCTDPACWIGPAARCRVHGEPTHQVAIATVAS